MRPLLNRLRPWGIAWAVALAAGAGEGTVKVAPPPPPVRPAAAPDAPPPADVSLPQPQVALPTDAQCPALSAVKPPFPFSSGEVLEYDLDAMGMVAGKLKVSVRPPEGGALPIQVEAATNTLFSKIRKVTGGAHSFLNPKTLRPIRYVEDATENGVRKTSKAQFRSGERRVDLDWTWGPRAGKTSLQYGPEGLDVAGTLFLIRALPLKAGQQFCFDAYAIRRIWRVVGKIEAREHVSLPLGEFDAWHMSGVAIRTDDPRARREVHAWISDDAKRLPLAVVGTIDLGAVRATLTAVSRPGEKRARAEDPKRSLKW